MQCIMQLPLLRLLSLPAAEWLPWWLLFIFSSRSNLALWWRAPVSVCPTLNAKQTLIGTRHKHLSPGRSVLCCAALCCAALRCAVCESDRWLRIDGEALAVSYLLFCLLITVTDCLSRTKRGIGIDKHDHDHDVSHAPRPFTPELITECHGTRYQRSDGQIGDSATTQAQTRPTERHTMRRVSLRRHS